MPLRTTAPTRAITLYPRHDPLGGRIVTKGDEHLIEANVVQDFALSFLQSVGDLACVSTVAFDELAYTLSACS